MRRFALLALTSVLAVVCLAQGDRVPAYHDHVLQPGDADRSDFAWRRASLSQDLESHCDLGGSDLLGIVLDPPGLRKDLIKFPLGGRANGSFLIEQESSRTGCALVER